MDSLLVTFLICLILNAEQIVGSVKQHEEKFEFNRTEPGNELGITTKVIAHIHRPAKSSTERWTLNREFTPDAVVEALNATCSDQLIDKKLKWTNCEIEKEGFTAELTFGRPETKNKTYVYLAMSYKPYERIENGKGEICVLDIVKENPVYFLMETSSKIPSNDSLPKSSKEFVDAVHIHQLGKFGKEFLNVYGDSLDQDGIYNFDVMDYYERDQLYECFLSIGSSESASVLGEKCPMYCIEEMKVFQQAELKVSLSNEKEKNEDSNNDFFIMNRNRASEDKDDSERDDSEEETVEDVEYSDEEMDSLINGVRNEL